MAMQMHHLEITNRMPDLLLRCYISFFTAFIINSDCKHLAFFVSTNTEDSSCYFFTR